MKKDLKKILKTLDRIEENQQGQLQGGFFAIGGLDSLTSFKAKNKGCTIINNCAGRNCVSGCSSN